MIFFFVCVDKNYEQHIKKNYITEKNLEEKEDPLLVNQPPFYVAKKKSKLKIL